MPEQKTFAAGSRVVIRDEEWLVKATLPTNTGGVAVRCIGLSELVRNHEALFLSELDDIQELRPESTGLVPDQSARYRRTRLYLESLLRRTPPTDERIYLGDHAAINPAIYQLTPAHMALKALRPRILIADGVGLGKTIEAGILLSELIKRGRGDRILVVAIRSMLAQFQQEIWARFSIPLVRLDSIGLQRVRARIPANKNPFYYYDRAIISIDTLKNDAQYRHYLEQCHWDVIVIDECHNVANTGSQRNRLASLLARTCDSLILTSATPHNGRSESFANLMNMLEPTAIADVHSYTAEEIEGLFCRRFKKDVEDEVGDYFSEREVKLHKLAAGRAEEAFFDSLASARFHSLHRGRVRDELYRIGLLKGFLSSPAACIRSIDGRLKRIDLRLRKLRGEPIQEQAIEAIDDVLSREMEEEEAARQLALIAEERNPMQTISGLEDDRATLARLRDLAAAIDAGDFTKYQTLLTLLRELNATGKPSGERVIIFSERIATLDFLHENLLRDLNARPDAIVRFHAGLPDVDQQQIVESFGKEDSPIRILLASDVASEGVNLHYYCHLMIHFDIPWSLITLEQRNGRIDRYGQAQKPLIHYLLTLSANELIQGDLRILERLIEKEQEAHKNIGDAATLLGLHNAQLEEKHITERLAEGAPPDQILPDQPQEAEWWLSIMEEVEQETAREEEALGTMPTLFPDDLSFARAAFRELDEAGTLRQPPEYHPDRPEFELLAPDDLRRRCAFMPDEALPPHWIFNLTTDRQRVMKAIAAARREENAWPGVHLFWELHPVMEWLVDKLLVRFGRHEAPVIITRTLDPKEFFLLFQGVISNRRSQPVIVEWFGLLYDGEYDWQPYSLTEVLSFTGFDRGVPNMNKTSLKLPLIRDLLPDAVEAATRYMKEQRTKRAGEERQRLREDMGKLQRWLRATEARIEPLLADAIGARRSRLQHELDETRKLYKQRESWLNETYTTDATPYIRLAAVFSGS